MAQLIIRRIGTFKIRHSQFSENQCTQVGQLDYQYKVKCKIQDPVFDNKGFVFDHNKLDGIVQDFFAEQTMLSCEHMIINLADHIVVKLNIRQMISLRVTLTPLVVNPVAKATYILSSTEIRELINELR